MTTRDTVEVELRKIFVALLHVDPREVTGAKRLVEDFGVSSLAAARLSMAIEERFGVELTISDAQVMVTFDAAIDCVYSKVGRLGLPT